MEGRDVIPFAFSFSALSHAVSGTWFALTKRLLHEHCPPASGTPNLIIPLTSESLYSLPAWQGDLNPQHGDWLQLQGCVRDRSPGKCAGAWRRRTQGVAPGGVGSAGVRSGGVRSAGVRASAARESGQNCLVSLLEWGWGSGPGWRLGSCPKRKKYIGTVEKLMRSGLRGGVDALARTEQVRPGAGTWGVGSVLGCRRKDIEWWFPRSFVETKLI